MIQNKEVIIHKPEEVPIVSIDPSIGNNFVRVGRTDSERSPSHLYGVCEGTIRYMRIVDPETDKLIAVITMPNTLQVITTP